MASASMSSSAPTATTRSGDRASAISMAFSVRPGRGDRRSGGLWPERQELERAFVVSTGRHRLRSRFEIVLDARGGAADLGQEDIGEEANHEDHHRQGRKREKLASVQVGQI